MASEPAPAKPSFRLTNAISGPVELRRVMRELATLDEKLHQAGLRKGGKPAALPNVSRNLDALAEQNRVNLLLPAGRTRLRNYLTIVDERAPRLHISLAADPSPAFVGKLIDWLRSNVAAYVLVQIGVQPNIGAGCILRTPSQQYDFSLRRSLEAHAGDLHSALKQVTAA